MSGPRHSPLNSGRAWLKRGVETYAQLSASAGLRRLGAILSAGVMALAFGLAWRVLRDVEPSLMLKALGSASPLAVLAAVTFTGFSYGCLAIEEWCEIWLVARRLPKGRTALTSFAANSLSAVLGFGMASGPAVRLRLYRWSGLGPRKITIAAVLRSLATYVSGIVAMGAVILVDPAPLAAALGLPSWVVVAGAGLLMAPGLLWFVLLRRRTTSARRSQLSTRGRAIALCAGIGDWIFSGMALFVLTGQGAASAPSFLAIFCLGSLAGSLAGVPAGLGVLEAAILNLHAQTLMHETAAALILYRSIYFIAPLALTAAALGLRPILMRIRALNGVYGADRRSATLDRDQQGK